MKYSYAILITLLLSSCASSVKRLHQDAVLVDTHNDVLSSQVLEGKDISQQLKEGHSDLYRWKAGSVDVQFFSVFTGETSRNKEGFFADAMQEIDSLHHIILRNPDKMAFATNYREVKKWVHKDRLVSLIGVEGGHMIEGEISKLEELYKKGMRYLTLTWNNSTNWASSAMDETLYPDKLKQKGLTDFGKQVVRRMNELGIIVDLSHVGEKTFYDALAVTSKPVILSHSSVWNICPVFRNVKDDQIKAVARNGGVVCINFYSGFISKEFDQRQNYLNKTAKDSLFPLYLVEAKGDSAAAKTKWEKYYNAEMNKVRPGLSQLVDHIDYITKLVGDDYAGIGSDFDGVSSLPVGINDVSSYPKITEELKKRGYSNKSVKKILGDNVLRVMKANFK